MDRAAWKPAGPVAQWRYGNYFIDGIQAYRDGRFVNEWRFNVMLGQLRNDGVLAKEVIMGGFQTADAARAYVAKLIEKAKSAA